MLALVLLILTPSCPSSQVYPPHSLYAARSQGGTAELLFQAAACSDATGMSALSQQAALQDPQHLRCGSRPEGRDNTEVWEKARGKR